VLETCPELNKPGAELTRSNSLETVRNMVASGLGISVLPGSALIPKYHSKLVVSVPFSEPKPSRRIGLAYRKSFPRPAAIHAIKAAFADLKLPYARSLVQAGEKGVTADLER
jgi:LysR family hydrogen peroxide-inducible transcriptional activator